MPLTAGIVGLPNVGKSTLFNAITKRQILTANYPFATIDPNVGIVTVPDKRLAKLEEMYVPLETIPTTFEFTDIAGLVKGASLGEGLGNKFLSHIREVDAICHVVRCFEDTSIIHIEEDVNPIRDVEIINLELILADLEVVENRLQKVEKKAVSTREKVLLEELELLKKLQSHLDQNISLRNFIYNEDELKMVKNYNLLTFKPIVYIANVAETDLIKSNKYIDLLRQYAVSENAEVIEVCAKIESELSLLNDEDKFSFLKELHIEESGLDKLIRATYSLLGLATFFTCGEKEVRAWTFKKGMKAPECAGIIHSDFERGFIRSETIGYDDLVSCGSEKEAREKGKMRLEGKEYIMKDGDICHFRFNI
jgi:ribosome-binding ATPase